MKTHFFPKVEEKEDFHPKRGRKEDLNLKKEEKEAEWDPRCEFLGEHPQRPEFRFLLLSVSNHIFPRSDQCLDARVWPLQLIHFARGIKP